MSSSWSRSKHSSSNDMYYKCAWMAASTRWIFRMRRVIELADEWMPHPDRGEQPLRERIAEFHAMSEGAGRGRLPVTVYGTPSDAAAVEQYVAAGVTRTVFRLPAAPADKVLPALDRAAEVAQQFES